jgi:hypothetical protein
MPTASIAGKLPSFPRPVWLFDHKPVSRKSSSALKIASLILGRVDHTEKIWETMETSGWDDFGMLLRSEVLQW